MNLTLDHGVNSDIKKGREWKIHPPQKNLKLLEDKAGSHINKYSALAIVIIIITIIIIKSNFLQLFL